MVSPSRGAVRVARAIAWTSAAFVLSVGAHVIGGGEPPSAGGALLMVIALLWTGLMLTRWRLGSISLVLSLGASQVLLHSILTATEVSVACRGSGGHHEVVLACATGTPAPHHHNGAAMLLAHVAATLLLALLMARGEEALWLLAGRLWPLHPREPALPSLNQSAITPSHVDGLVPSVPLLGGVGRRGPPVQPTPVTA
ncbi:hypothetical protein [Janibacter cremeus]|uniref:Uncharacterized protein n=1 Tax=Janibacter cremeus TaxID=1285192 RepID=A0A852VW67_9MICO|nr:hypothetical protein [Janibacter cremeus]NYF97781.1 hypothetical protein [Janibacter cremeus]